MRSIGIETPESKPQVWIGLGWLPYFNLDLSCTEQGGVELLTAFVLALVANQSTYLITPKLSNGTPSNT